MKRRDFLKTSSILGLSNLVPLSLFGGEFNDYKALVVVMLHGGNDGFNMVVPTSESGYNNYATNRGDLAIAKDALTLSTDDSGKLTLSKGEGNPYYKNNSIKEAYKKGLYHTTIDGIGINPLMPEFAHLVNSNKIAVAANMGLLHEPSTKEALLSGKAKRPLYMYSHNSQRELFYIGNSQKPGIRGLAGALADKWGDINNNSVYKLNMAIDSASKLQYGDITNPIVVSRNGPKKFTKVQDDERELYNRLLQIEDSSEFLKAYKKLKVSTFAYQDRLVNDWNNVGLNLSSTNSYGDALFSHMSESDLGVDEKEKPGTRFIDKMKALLKLIKIGKDSGLKRQIFYVEHFGYDTHGNQTLTHAKLLRELSIALYDFQTAIDELGLSQNVTTFNISDFGRSAGNNGDGSDHAWGSHYFIMGGAVKGGLYGQMPDLTLGGQSDITKKGRIIPTISHAQYYSTLLKWFGVDSSTIEQILPEVKNFNVKDLGFLA